MATIKTRFKLSTCNAFGTKKCCSATENFAETASGMQTYYSLQKRRLKALPEPKSNPKRNRIAAMQREEDPCPEMQ